MAMKRRLSDYQSISGNNSAPLYRTQKVSFKMFQQKEANHVKALYPFLTKTQINSKVRELWKNMSDTEKENFSKVVLTKTPTKSPVIGKISTGNRSTNSSKTRCSIWKDFKSESKSKTYQNDFASPEIAVKKNKSSPSWLVESPSIPVTKDYSKSRAQPDVVPEIIDMTPNKQPGILKQTAVSNIELEESPIKKKNRVSFSPQRKDQDKAECMSETSLIENSPAGYSSEEDETLIRRDYDAACNFDDIEKFPMCIENDDPLACQSYLNRKTAFVEGIEKSEKQNEKEDTKEHDMEPNNIDINTVKIEKPKTRASKRNKSVGNEKLSVKQSPSKITKSVVKKVTTPDLTAARITRSTPMITKSNIDEYTTPLLTKSNTDQYTTPLMDDATMNQLTEQAKQAPKKRQSRGGEKAKILEEADDSKPSEVNKKHHVRTSLISVKSEELRDESMIDASGDAKIDVCTDKIQESGIDAGQLTDDNNNINSDDEEEDELMPPICTTLGSYFKIPDKPHDIELSESNSSEDEVFEACKSTSNSSVLETLKRMKEVVCNPSTPANSPISSPKILSPALSGISQLSSASSDSKGSLSGAGIETQKQEVWDNKMDDKTETQKQEVWDNEIDNKTETQKQEFWDNEIDKTETQKQEVWDNEIDNKTETQKQEFWDNEIDKTETQKQEVWDDEMDDKTESRKHNKEKRRPGNENHIDESKINQNQDTSKQTNCTKDEIVNGQVSKSEGKSNETSVKKENLTKILRKTDKVNDEICWDTSSKENLENGDKHVCTDKPKDIKKPKITRFAKRKAPTALQELAKPSDKALCELFYDLTPPEEKHKKTSNRRVLASAVTPGKSNFNLLFDNKTIF